jgi:PD-(D/E)XK nuclease superfamily
MKLRYTDSNHSYWLDGKRCRGISTTAKILDDTYDLDRWRKRMVAKGVAMSDELVEAINGLDEGDKSSLDDLAEQAIILAGATTAADRGTRQHAVTEAHDRGEKHDDPVTADRWASTLKAAGFRIEDALIERCVVWPEQKIVGRFDRLAWRESDGQLVVIDLKTGSSAIRYPQSTVLQLTMYANAPLLAGEMTEFEEGKFETEEFTPMPAVLDPDVGYIIHLPDDGDGGVYSVNLRLGLRAAKDIVFPALRWRGLKHDKLIRKVI